MSVKFNQEIKNVKTKIQEQCALYRSNFMAFVELIDTIKRRNQFNETDIKNCEQIINQMNNGDVRVIFCGQVKSGKTKCVMEFLCGSIELPSKDTPATKYFTKISYSDSPILYSESADGDKKYHDFDGKYVSETLVENRENTNIDEEDLDIIFHIGIDDTFLKGGVVVIDSPGLNETKRLDEVFGQNLKKLNPQMVIYVFNYGPGFVDSDSIYYTKVIANLRRDLRKIFLFNKFDEAFKPSITFPDVDESDNDICSTDDSSEDDSNDEIGNFDELYQKEFDKHKRHLDDIHCDMSCACFLIGYSGKYTSLHRCKKDQLLKQFRNKHLELLNHFKCNINSMDIDVLETILCYTKQFLFSEFQTIFKQILLSNNTSQYILLSICYKEKILKEFDSSHEKLLNITISQIQQINFDGDINQIVKNQERIQTTVIQSKIFNIIKSLTKYFIDRYVNYFSNIIFAKIEELNFDKLNDELRLNGVDNLFSHTFCSLSNTDTIESVIKKYFETEQARIISLCNNTEKNHFNTTEACTFYIKSNYKFQKEFIWVHIDNFIKTVIKIERTNLQQAIDDKKNKIILDLKVSKEQIKVMITDSLFIFKKWLQFNNNHITEQSKSDFTKIERKKFFDKLVNTSITDDDKELIEHTNLLNIVFKSERVNLDDLSFNNCELIKFFLRNEYIISNVCKTTFYYKENEQYLYFITDLEDWKPLRLFLNDSLLDNEKFEIIKKLISILICCYEQCLYIDNFGPDIVFCRRSTEGVELKIVESAQRFHEWKYTLVDGECSNNILHKYPFYDSDNAPSMFYALCWTILIIIHGCCDNLFPSCLNENNFLQEIVKNIPEFYKNEIVDGCYKIIKLVLKGAIKFNEIEDIVTILKDMIL